jgi:arylsulfatase
MNDPAKLPEPVRNEREIEGMPEYMKKEFQEGRFKELNENWRELRAGYYGEISFIDDNIGRLLQTLDELDIRENTLVIFISDHGDLLGDHWLWYKGKPHYTASIKVPFIINWPGHIKEGKVVDGIVQQTDVFPTVSELLGLDI